MRDDFHPKRNQARQKLATLPTSRFKDLSSDVYYELVRRYPEFKEEACLILPHPLNLRFISFTGFRRYSNISRLYLRRLPIS